MRTNYTANPSCNRAINQLLLVVVISYLNNGKLMAICYKIRLHCTFVVWHRNFLGAASPSSRLTPIFHRGLPPPSLQFTELRIIWCVQQLSRYSDWLRVGRSGIEWLPTAPVIQAESDVVAVENSEWKWQVSTIPLTSWHYPRTYMLHPVNNKSDHLPCNGAQSVSWTHKVLINCRQRQLYRR